MAQRVAAEMFQRNALTIGENDKIQTKSYGESGCEILLNVLLEEPREMYECFLEALRQTDQDHVYVHIECQGKKKHLT